MPTTSGTGAETTAGAVITSTLFEYRHKTTAIYIEDFIIMVVAYNEK